MIWVVLLIVGLLGAAFFLSDLGYPRAAVVPMTFAAVLLGAFVVVLGVQGEMSRVPVPAPLPSHGPACADMAWLDGKWTCIPEEERG